MIAKLWARLVAWFERGDLVPLLVVVSAWHYVAILAGRDPWPIAIALGLLVDLSHYRTVRAAVRYSGRTRESVARWSVALAMTVVALAYHLRYYDYDWWLAAPVPVLIATLAWLNRVDGRTGARTPAQPVKAKQPEPRTFTAECECGWCKNGYRSQKAATNALNAHKRRCKERA